MNIINTASTEVYRRLLLHLDVGLFDRQVLLEDLGLSTTVALGTALLQKAVFLGLEGALLVW